MLLRLITAVLPVLLLLSACDDDSDGAARDQAPVAHDSATPPPGHEEAGRAFVDVLHGRPQDELWAGSVGLYVAGKLSSTLAPADVADPARWVGCPGDVPEYNGRECPVSLLRQVQALHEDGGALVFEDQVPEVVGCDLVRAPPGVDGSDSVTIRPDVDHRSCFRDFAITLYLDDRGRLGTVAVTISGP